jgi:hypothetical protein
VHILEHYDILLRARHALLDWVRGLTAEQYRQEFPFGLGTVRATLVHLAGSEWLHGRAARGEDITERRPFTGERYPDFLSLEGAWRGLEASTRAWLESESDWARPIRLPVDGAGSDPRRRPSKPRGRCGGPVTARRSTVRFAIRCRSCAPEPMRTTERWFLSGCSPNPTSGAASAW